MSTDQAPNSTAKLIRPFCQKDGCSRPGVILTPVYRKDGSFRMWLCCTFHYLHPSLP